MFTWFYIGAKLFGLPTQSHLTMAGDVWAFVLFFVIGITIIRVADRFVGFAYRSKEED
jgi:hypothetical protein